MLCLCTHPCKRYNTGKPGWTCTRCWGDGFEKNVMTETPELDAFHIPAALSLVDTTQPQLDTPGKFCYEYPRPAVTVDLVVIGNDTDAKQTLKVLLVRRKNEPFKGRWAIPGGFLNMDELAEDAAKRELLEETGYRTNAKPQFLGYFDRVDRDPRTRVISLAFIQRVAGLPEVEGRDDAEEARWMPITTKGLAFDHDEILSKAIDWLVDNYA